MGIPTSLRKVPAALLGVDDYESDRERSEWIGPDCRPISKSDIWCHLCWLGEHYMVRWYLRIRHWPTR